MVKRISEFMANHQTGLFIVGMNHLHSTMSKLRIAGFDATGGNWLKIPDTAKQVECTHCHELIEVRIERDAKILAG